MRHWSAAGETKAALELRSPGFKSQISHSMTGQPWASGSPPSVSPSVEWASTSQPADAVCLP